MRKAGPFWGWGRTGKSRELTYSSNKPFVSESKGLLYLKVVVMDSSGSINYSKVLTTVEHLKILSLSLFPRKYSATSVSVALIYVKLYRWGRDGVWENCLSGMQMLPGYIKFYCAAGLGILECDEQFPQIGSAGKGRNCLFPQAHVQRYNPVTAPSLLWLHSCHPTFLRGGNIRILVSIGSQCPTEIPCWLHLLTTARRGWCLVKVVNSLTHI